MKRMEKARKKAASIIENDDLGSREKVTEIKRLYKKAAAGKRWLPGADVIFFMLKMSISTTFTTLKM
jgi:hypothetical protein